MKSRALFMIGLLGVTTVAEGATRTANSRARTLKPITMTRTRDLDFGRLVIAATAGRVTVNATTDARARTGGVTLIGGGAPGAARFAVTGTPAALAQITLGAAPTLNRSSGPQTVSMTALTLNGGRNRRFTAAGALDVRVGGTLAVPANQLGGDYAGSFTVTISYQ